MAGLAYVLLFILSGQPTAPAHINLSTRTPVGKAEPAKTATQPEETKAAQQPYNNSNHTATLHP